MPHQRPCILLLSPHCSYRLAPYLNAAQKLNLDAIVVSQGEHSLVSAVASGIHIDFDHPDVLGQVTAAVTDRDIKTVIGTDDRTVELAAELSKSFGLNFNDPQSIRYTRRKDLARVCLRHSAVNIPDFQIITLDETDKKITCEIDFPVVVKPIALSGSRGVIRANSHEEFTAALQCLQTILEQTDQHDEKNKALVERYIPGYEYAYEGLLQHGELMTLAIFDKPDLMEGPYFEETYYITPSRLSPAIQQAIKEAVSAACLAYGLQQGPIHAEVKLYDDKIWFIEMASRTVGGQCARLFSYATGLSLEETVLAQAAGLSIKQAPMQDAAGVLMIPIKKRGLLRRVEGLLQASKVEFIEDIEISIQEGYELVPLPEGDSYLGFIFAKAPTPGQVEQALRDAYDMINIITTPLLHTTEWQSFGQD